MGGTSLVLISWVFLSLFLSSIAGLSQEEKTEKLLKQLNKPHVKTFNIGGDIIDCVPLYKQPAFDHPLLKNHQIEMRPSILEKGQSAKIHKNNSENKGRTFKTIPQLRHQNESCPHGTVPIPRIRKEDILRAPSIESFGKKPNGTELPLSGSKRGPPSTHEYATYRTQNRPLYGTQTYIGIWDPIVNGQQSFSLTQIWVVGRRGTFTVEAGWQVYYHIYGDERPRLFTYWTSDDYRTTGCYNVRCPGFVQVHPTIHPGMDIRPISVHDGNQMEVQIRIFEGSSGWWLYYQRERVGYWPHELYGGRFKEATEIRWGGEVAYPLNTHPHPKIEMGSGYFAEAGWKKASLIRSVQVYTDSSAILRDPVNLEPSVTRTDCYRLGPVSPTRYPNWGTYFFYGGPGGHADTCR